MPEINHSKAILLYDGFCVLCNGAVAFVSPRIKSGEIEYLSLQSERGQAILKSCGLSQTDLDTFILYREGTCMSRSRAALELTKLMKWPWWLLKGLLIVPEAWRDWVYDVIARNRTQWFGRINNK